MKYQKQHEKIVEICQTARTLTEVEVKFGTSSPNTSLRKYIKMHDILMPNYEGRSAANRLSQATRKLIDETNLCENSVIQTGSIKKFLIRSGKKTEACEICGWCEKHIDGQIPVHLHHINGDSSDHRLENLQMLCPNHHALTKNFGSKNKNSKRRLEQLKEKRLLYSAPRNTCQCCGKLGYGEKYCSNRCLSDSAKRVIWPSKEQLAEELKTLSWTALGKKYGVSDNAVRKWAKNYNLI